MTSAVVVFTLLLVILIDIPQRADSFSILLSHHTHRSQQQSFRHQAAAILHADQPLIPEPNPSFVNNSTAASRSGVLYSTVLNEVILPLYPAEQLSERVALSRSQGYWPYLQQTKATPPPELTYGEFDFLFFAQLLDRALELYHDNYNNGTCWDDCVFTDLGSGMGRLVLAAAALHKWKLCRGVEVLSDLHAEAQQRAASATPSLLLSDVHFSCGSITDPYEYFGDSDVVFCFSTCMEAPLLEQVTQAIGRQCRPGTVVITTDYPLFPLSGYIPPPDDDDDRIPTGNFRISCVDQVEGWCWLTGGASTAYLHVVEESLWEESSKPLERPVPSLEDVALRVVQQYESGELVDESFATKVYNNMVFYGLPTSLYPRLPGRESS